MLLKKYEPEETYVTFDPRKLDVAVELTENGKTNVYLVGNEHIRELFGKEKNRVSPIKQMKNVINKVGNPLSSEEFENTEKQMTCIKTKKNPETRCIVYAIL
ncbi:MAG: hypothetical protein JW700_00815 [Candidatus Aenigmarchaeota archaeon]|nr:hypothetical protein [Candidatus Aenigmarchaeota archaeon]